MVSGVERPDPAVGQKTMIGSTEDHVHIGLVVSRPIKRTMALNTVCPAWKMLPPGSVYAVPRNQKFPYAGWVCHHSKDGFKLNGEPGLRYEHGILPMDTFERAKLEQIDRLVKKFGNEEMKQRFKHYQDSLKLLKDFEEPLAEPTGI
jgi:hypothetical protein